MTRAEQIRLNRKAIQRLAKQYGVTDIRVFGSARGETIHPKATLISSLIWNLAAVFRYGRVAYGFRNLARL